MTSGDNEMVLKILISQILAQFFLKFAFVFNFLNFFCHFLVLTIFTGQQNFFQSCRWITRQNSGDNKML